MYTTLLQGADLGKGTSKLWHQQLSCRARTWWRSSRRCCRRGQPGGRPGWQWGPVGWEGRGEAGQAGAENAGSQQGVAGVWRQLGIKADDVAVHIKTAQLWECFFFGSVCYT
jgi:hypothetical protein